MRLIRFLDAALYPSTRAFIRRCFNIAVNAIVAAACFVVLAAIVILLNLLIDYLLKDVSDSVRNFVSPISDVLPIVFVVATAMNSVFDIIKLAIASLKSSNN